MARTDWMIYGATGYTGALLAEEAVRRGHRPLLAGRSEAKLRPLAEKLGLDFVAVGLDDHERLTEAVRRVRLVLHCAGPFAQTSAPMLRACLTAGADYLDITGEIPVFENVFAYDSAAKERKIALIPGCGFDVIPTDCLAIHVASQVQDAVELEIAFSSSGPTGTSAGTGLTTLAGLGQGGLERRNGKLVALPLGQGGQWVRFPGRDRHVIPIPWGDLATAYRSTRIPNITTHIALAPGQARAIRMAAPLIMLLLSIGPVRSLAQGWVRGQFKGPDERKRLGGRTLIWARAADVKGSAAEAWLDIPEAYQFTMVAGVRCVERVLAGGISGALTPAQAFGADFVLEIEGTRRLSELEQ